MCGAGTVPAHAAQAYRGASGRLLPLHVLLVCQCPRLPWLLKSPAQELNHRLAAGAAQRGGEGLGSRVWKGIGGRAGLMLRRGRRWEQMRRCRTEVQAWLEQGTSGPAAAAAAGRRRWCPPVCQVRLMHVYGHRDAGAALALEVSLQPLQGSRGRQGSRRAAGGWAADPQAGLPRAQQTSAHGRCGATARSRAGGVPRTSTIDMPSTGAGSVLRKLPGAR